MLSPAGFGLLHHFSKAVWGDVFQFFEGVDVIAGRRKSAGQRNIGDVAVGRGQQLH